MQQYNRLMAYYLTVTAHPVVIIFNFIDLMVKETWDNTYEMEQAMSCYEILGGDLLTAGDCSSLDIVLCTNERLSFRI